MRAPIAILACVTAFNAFAEDWKPLIDPAQQKQITEELHALVPGSRVFLYAVDPRIAKRRVPPRESFHGYRVIGRAEITDPTEKQALFGALAQGIVGSQGAVANCFEPRHGLRIERGNLRVDLNICFQCLQIYPYGFNRDKGISISSTPEATFDTSLKKHDLRKSKA